MWMLLNTSLQNSLRIQGRLNMFYIYLLRDKLSIRSNIRFKKFSSINESVNIISIISHLILRMSRTIRIGPWRYGAGFRTVRRLPDVRYAVPFSLFTARGNTTILLHFCFNRKYSSLFVFCVINTFNIVLLFIY